MPSTRASTEQELGRRAGKPEPPPQGASYWNWEPEAQLLGREQGHGFPWGGGVGGTSQDREKLVTLQPGIAGEQSAAVPSWRSAWRVGWRQGAGTGWRLLPRALSDALAQRRRLPLCVCVCVCTRTPSTMGCDLNKETCVRMKARHR